MRVLWFESLDSTQKEALRQLEKGETPPFAVVAEEQTSGRGRYGHRWYSPKGGLWTTLVLQAPKEKLFLAAPLACVRFLEKRAGLSARIKLPNDIRVRGKKIGGVLIEATDGLTLAGIGLNLNISEFPPELREATSVFLETGREIPLREALIALVGELMGLVSLDLEPLTALWRERVETFGKLVQFRYQGRVLRGILRDMTPDFRLVLQMGDCCTLGAPLFEIQDLEEV